ncbi:MAG TPA: alpha-mannosidase [Bacteroidota bacterium]|nr:alpha-mannosidase [Bacteroidota bacterium]
MILDLLDQILPHVKNSIYPASLQLRTWKVKEGDIENAYSPTLKDNSWGTIQIPTAWGGYNRTVWFRTKVSIPEPFAGKTVGVVFDFPEALLYVNGKPHQGIDPKHPEALISRSLRAGENLFLAVQAYSGRKKELNPFNRADLVVIDTTARALYNRLRVLREMDKLAGPGTHESKDIRELIRRTLIFLKYFRPGSEEYPNAIARANNFLNKTIGSEFLSTTPGLVHLLGQSHIDVAWLWTQRETRRKCARTFSTVLRLMEEFPEFRFTQSQPLLYEFVKQSYPDIYRQIKERVTEGRWELASPSWVEPDCNLPSGESLVRQILFGKRFYRQEFGIEPTVMWLPDSFGFPASLPQILKKSGIHYFATTKLSWNDTTKFPYNTFWWQGIDGTRILSHMPPLGLEAQLNPKDIRKTWEEFRQKETLGEVLQTFGYGDGGGGPSSDQLDLQPILQNIISVPKSKLSSLQSFFAALSEASPELPIWSDELYLERHRGTFTTHGWIKKENRECEILLFNAELFSVIASLIGRGSTSRHHATQLQEAWKKLLVNQFHDILSGTSIPAVFDEARDDYTAIRSMTSSAVSESAAVLLGRLKNSKSFTFTLFNTLPWTRDAYVNIEVPMDAKSFVVQHENGKLVEHQIIEKSRRSAKLLCFVKQLPPLSLVSLTVAASAENLAAQDPWPMTPKKAETPLFRLRLNKHGQIISLQEKKSRRDLIKSGALGNILQTFPDRAKQWDAWDIDADCFNRKVELFKTKSIEVTETGPLRGTIRIEHRSPNGSRILQNIHLYHQLPIIEFETTVQWAEQQILLKVAFPLNVKTNVATYEIPFGAIKRTTKPKTPAEMAKFEVPAQQWADLSDSKFGISLLNNCKYGYDAKQSTLRLTLIRSPFYPHPLDPAHLNDTKVTDQGTHAFTYALYPHSGDWKKGETVRRARELNNPVLIFQGKPKFSLLPFLKISNPAIQLSSVKFAEEGDETVVRLYESHGESVKTTVEFGHTLLKATECDLLENEIQKLKGSKGKFSLSFKPFEIKTLKVKLKGRVKKAR